MVLSGDGELDFAKVRYWRQLGQDMLSLGSSALDLDRVKTLLREMIRIV